MTEFALGLAVPVVLVLIAIAYGLRRLRHGDARFDRVDRIGGSSLVGKRWLEMGYWAMQPVARLCVAVGLSANALSWISLLLGALAGAALAWGRFGSAAVLCVVSSACDALDGFVARETGTASDAGEVLDASIDRYAEFFFFAGLIVHYSALPQGVLLTLAALAGSFMVSYSTAKAEALDVTPPRGAMRRHERVVYLVGGAALTALLAHTGWASAWFELPMLLALGAVGVIGNISAVHRLWTISRAIRLREGALEVPEASAPHPKDDRRVSAT